MKKNEVYLLKLISEKDKKAFAELYDIYVKQINEFVYKKTRDASLTEDITQEFWLYLWKSPLEFIPKENGTVKAYLLQHLRFRIFDVYRASLPKSISLDNSGILDGQEMWYTHILESIEERELYRYIKEVVTKHSPIKQEIFYLRFADHSIEKISENLGVSKRTIYNYYHEVLICVRSHIEKLHPHLVKDFAPSNKKKNLSFRSLLLSLLM